MINVLIIISGIRIKVLTLVNRFISLLFMLASPPTPLAPNAGSATALDHPTRARNRSSESMAIAFTRRTEMYIRFPKAKNIILNIWSAETVLGMCAGFGERNMLPEFGLDSCFEVWQGTDQTRLPSVMFGLWGSSRSLETCSVFDQLKLTHFSQFLPLGCLFP